MSLFTALVLLLLLRLLLGPRVKRMTLLSATALVAVLGAYLWLIATQRPTEPTSVAAQPQQANRLQQQLEQGLRDDDLELIARSLADGADASNAAGRDSYLTLARSTDARQLLLSSGASPDGLPTQDPPLLKALGDDDLPLYRWLLNAGADPNRATDALPELLVVTLFNHDDPAPWLQPLLDRGVDLNSELAGGLSTLDELLLSGLHPEWVQRLRNAGARHALLLDRGAALSPEHPAMLHVRDWLQAKRQPDWPDSEDRFVLRNIGRHGCDQQQPALAEATLIGRSEGDQALVEVLGPTDYGPRKTMIGLRRLTAEANPQGPAERPLDPAADDGLWRISGCAEDRRYSG